MKIAVMGVVPTLAKAESIVRKLQQAGFPKEDISVLFADEETLRTVTEERVKMAAGYAGVGAGVGGLLGGALGALVGLAAISIPGLGPFVAAGPILAALQGAQMGATVGTIAGALIGMGFPEVEAKRYEERVRRGRVLVAVQAEEGEQMKRAEEILRAEGAEDILSAIGAQIPRAEESPSRPR